MPVRETLCHGVLRSETQYGQDRSLYTYFSGGLLKTGTNKLIGIGKSRKINSDVYGIFFLFGRDVMGQT